MRIASHDTALKNKFTFVHAAARTTVALSPFGALTRAAKIDSAGTITTPQQKEYQRSEPLKCAEIVDCLAPASNAMREFPSKRVKISQPLLLASRFSGIKMVHRFFGSAQKIPARQFHSRQIESI